MTATLKESLTEPAPVSLAVTRANNDATLIEHHYRVHNDGSAPPCKVCDHLEGVRVIVELCAAYLAVRALGDLQAGPDYAAAQNRLALAAKGVRA